MNMTCEEFVSYIMDGKNKVDIYSATSQKQQPIYW
jgi:hypothetical protein